MSLTIKRFSAVWCGPCKIIAPIINQLEDEFKDIKFEHVDIDENKEVADQYDIMSVPTLVFEKDGVEVDRFSGFRPKEFIVDIIKNI